MPGTKTHRRRMIGIPVLASVGAHQREAAATRFRAAAASPVKTFLLAVADAIDRAGPIVGNEDRTVPGQDDIGRTTEITLIAFQPTRCEHFLLGVLAVG